MTHEEISVEVEIQGVKLPARLFPSPDGYRGVAVVPIERETTLAPPVGTPVIIPGLKHGSTSALVKPDPESDRWWRLDFTVAA